MGIRHVYHISIQCNKVKVIVIIFSCSSDFVLYLEGVVGWCEGAVYLTSPGRPTDIGLQLGKACYLCSG